ncbi:MAG: hypothetical protein HQK83_05380 [Fibrobacteria bacterium]|nr:hypothetical protein [Fibrobacteria bacterium]
MKILIIALLVVSFLPGQDNLLRNPEFQYFSSTKALTSQNVAYWDFNWRGDIEVNSGSSIPSQITATGNVVEIKAGKKFWQFANLGQLGLGNGDAVSLKVEGYQSKASSLTAHLALMLIESADGTWKPSSWGSTDTRTFSKHARGELIRVPDKTAQSASSTGTFSVKVENLSVTASFSHTTESYASYKNAAGILVEFENVSDQSVWIHSPVLVKGSAVPGVAPENSRALPDFYRRIPRTMAKLKAGEPIHIMTLGSSIDRGSANPPLFIYDENPASGSFKFPFASSSVTVSSVYPLWKGYIGWWQHYYVYTGRTRRDLLRKYDYDIKDMMLNIMALDGASIGETHSGFEEYATFTGENVLPSPESNGHESGYTWAQLYPSLFAAGTPAPDLVVFGHGHNEMIDWGHVSASFEGAVRWFQRHYPDVEFVSCMYMIDKGETNSFYPDVRAMFEYYDIPFIDAAQLKVDLEKTCNKYSLAPDGLHPQAAVNYMWGQLLNQAFELPAEPKSDIPQKYLPSKRYDPYAYGWEGDMLRINRGHARIVAKTKVVLEDCAFVSFVKASNPSTIYIDGKKFEFNAGAGTGWSMNSAYGRNASFMHGMLSLGDRHIIEVTGSSPDIAAIDLKVAPDREYFPAESSKWQGAAATQTFTSYWGAPYGTKMFVIPQNGSVTIDVKATDLSVAYVDNAGAGTLEVTVDGESKLSVSTAVPFSGVSGGSYYMENRRGIRDLPYTTHNVTLKATGGSVSILGLYTYKEDTTFGLANQAPTDISLSESVVQSNTPVGNVIGILSAVDPDEADSVFTFTLADSADGVLFTITGNQLKANSASGYDTARDYTIKVTASDDEGASFSKVLVISVQHSTGVLRKPITLNSWLKAEKLELLNLQGKLVLTIHSGPEQKINLRTSLSGLQGKSGLYFARLYNNGMVSLRKVVLE